MFRTFLNYSGQHQIFSMENTHDFTHIHEHEILIINSSNIESKGGAGVVEKVAASSVCSVTDD